MRGALFVVTLLALTAAFAFVSTGRASGGILAIDGGGLHTCVLLDGGDARCWGQNAFGQLGDGTTAGSGSPVDVVGLPGPAQAVNAGDRHTCALASQEVFCWGEHDGRLGIPEPDDEPSTTPQAVCADAGCASPLGDVVAVSSGGTHTCALIDGGAVRCWGENEDGQLGDGTMDDSPTPAAVVGLSEAVAIAAGGSHTCALTAAGAVYCWGSNGEGQIGDGRACGMRCAEPSPVIGAESGVGAITSAGLHSCALLLEGSVRCWGLNFDGQIGDGTEDDIRTESTPVSGLDSGVVQISADGRFRGHTCALLTSGGLMCWGDNDEGQLGDGTTDDRLLPVEVAGIVGFAAVSAGGAHTCALSETAVWCWGDNAQGQLGDGTTFDQPEPVAVRAFGKAAGDADCDGGVSSIDAALVLQHTAGLLNALPCEENADANRDGSVTSVDAALILQLTAGLLSQLPP